MSVTDWLTSLILCFCDSPAVNCGTAKHNFTLSTNKLMLVVIYCLLVMMISAEMFEGLNDIST